MKITTSQSIIIVAVIIALAILFRADDSFSLFANEAKAEVAGMDYFDLRSDYDFKRAVRYIVEDCEVSGYVDDDYLYGTDISC